MIYEIKDMTTVTAIFDGWNETLIWSCIQGVMGHIYANHIKHPTSAMAILGDFVFYAGVPSKEIIGYKPDWCKQDFIIAVPRDEQWSAMIREYYGNSAKQVVRYATKKEPDAFDKNKLIRISEGLQAEYTIKLIDERMYNYCRSNEWCRDLVSQYETYKIYKELGLGVVVLKDNIPVSGASSYSSYVGGIEIEIDTRKEYRRKGLASACGAMLILECIKRGLYPSWDAQNKWSLALAQKLGYHFDYEYTAFEISGYSNEPKDITADASQDKRQD